MTRVLPRPREAQQLCRLRALRVERARTGVSTAQAGVERAEASVAQRQRAIARGRRAIEDLQHAVVHALAPTLPRWSGVTAAHQERLTDRLERDEYALISEEQALEEAQEGLQQARAELTRALAREDAVRGLADETRRAHALERERRAESEIDDQGRAPYPRAAGPR